MDTLRRICLPQEVSVRCNSPSKFQRGSVKDQQIHVARHVSYEARQFGWAVPEVGGEVDIAFC